MCPSTCGSVKIANDTFTKVAGEESINVLTYLPLSSALHVPQFYFNLLSASSCVKFFFLVIVCFRIWGWGKQLVLAMRKMFSTYWSQGVSPSHYNLQFADDDNKALLHRCLGHAPIQSHRSCSFLDIRNNVKKFDYETCQFANVVGMYIRLMLIKRVVPLLI